jgi:hypothetical protein
MGKKSFFFEHSPGEKPARHHFFVFWILYAMLGGDIEKIKALGCKHLYKRVS